ncbi:MAG: hypothetical protein KBT35_05860 [Firmicutes bacterium]|nr:hypothetical protein [Candidatus Colivicinus equi]
MDRYTARINAYGTTPRERNVNLLKAGIVSKAFANPSMKSVFLNGEEIDLVIDDGTSNSYKKFSSLPNQIIRLGDYIKFNERMYLVTSLNTDDEIYSSGIMSICMYVLRWQKKDGTIIERWCVPQDFTKYDSGQVANGVITIPSNQYGIIVPIDNETKVLPRDTRFVMDIVDDIDVKNGAIPDTYMLTNEKPILYDYRYFNRGGIITFTFKFDAFNSNTDKWVNCGDHFGWICDYVEKEKSEIISVTIPNEDSMTDESYVSIVNVKANILGSDTIKDRKRTWKVEFLDEENNPVDFTDFKWEINCMEYDDFIDVIPNESDVYSIGLKCRNGKDDIGKSFIINIKHSSTSTIISSMNVDVVSM